MPCPNRGTRPVLCTRSITGPRSGRPGTVLVTLFVDPARRQHLLGTVRIRDHPNPTGRDEAPMRAEQAVRLLCVRCPTPDAPPQLVFVVARKGRVVFRDSDLAWVGWLPRSGRPVVARLAVAGPPELLLVTEHGFRCWRGATAARHPALRALPRRPAGGQTIRQH